MQPSAAVESGPYPCLHLVILFLVLHLLFFATEFLSRDRSGRGSPSSILVLAVFTPFYVGIFYVGPAIILSALLHRFAWVGQGSALDACFTFDTITKIALGLAVLDSLAMLLARRSTKPKASRQMAMGLGLIPAGYLTVVACTAGLTHLVVAWREIDPLVAGNPAKLFDFPQLVPEYHWNLAILALLLFVGCLITPLVTDLHRAAQDHF